MLPRRQIREAWFAVYNTMTLPTTKVRGRVPRFQSQDLPAINMTTYTDRSLEEEATHGNCTELHYEQDIVIELYAAVDQTPDTSNFEDDIEEIEEEFWQVSAPLNIPGVKIAYTGSDLVPVKDAETPQAVRLLTFTATYRVDQAAPDIIITT